MKIVKDRCQTVEREHRKADSQFGRSGVDLIVRPSPLTGSWTRLLMKTSTGAKGIFTCLHHLHLFSKAVRLLKQWQVQEQKHVALIIFQIQRVQSDLRMSTVHSGLPSELPIHLLMELKETATKLCAPGSLWDFV